MLKKLFKCFWMWLLLLICSTVSAQDNDALNTIRQTYDGTEYIGAYFIRVQYLDNKYLCDDGTNTYVALYTGNAPADAATSCVWYVYKYNDNGKYRYFIQNVSTGRFFDRDYDRSDENKVSVSDYGDGYRSKLIALADATLSNLRMSLGSDDLNINEYESPEEAMNIVSYATGNRTVLSVGEPGSDQLNNSYTAYISNEGKFSFGSCRFYLIADETRTPAKPKVKTNYLFAPPGTEINVTASWSGTDELAAPKWAFEYSTDGTNWTASPLEYINENVLTFDMQLQNVYVRAKITNATADMTSDGRDVSAAVLINGVNNDDAACENSASQTLLWERFDLNETSGDLSCSQQSYDGIAADYQYANGGCITNGKYAIVNNAGNGCHGKDGCIGGSNPERTWFISDYDHTGNVDDANKRIGGMLAVNFNQANAGNILNKQYELPLGTNLSLSFYVAPLTREIGTDAAGLTVYIEESEDGNNWSEVVKESHNISMTHKSYLDWEQISASIITSKKYARIRIHGDNSGDNGSDIVFDDISILACRPQLEWYNETLPLNADGDAFQLQNSKESWARAFGDDKTYFMVVEISDNDGHNYYAKAEVNNNGTCTTSYPCISAEDFPINLPFTVGESGNVYDADGAHVSEFSWDQSKLYTIQGKIYTNEAAYNEDNAGSQAVIISGQTQKLLQRPSIAIKVLSCENRDGSTIYNGTDLTANLEALIANSISETDVRAIMYEGDVPIGTVGPFNVPVVTVNIDANHEPSFDYNENKKIIISKDDGFKKDYTLIWEYNLDGHTTPYSAQPVTLQINDLPENISVATVYSQPCSNANGAVKLTASASIEQAEGELEYQWIDGTNTNDFADASKIKSNEATYSLSNLAAGTYAYTVRVRNNCNGNNHCSTDYSVEDVTIYAIPEEATLTATVNSEDVTTVCVTEPNNTINLTTAITSPTIDMAAINQQWKYEWSIVSGPDGFKFPNGQTQTVEERTANTAALSLTGVPFGNYTFKVKISNGTAGAENCTSIEKTIDIKVLERPTVIATATGDITANVTTACVEGATLGAATLTANVNDITGFGQSLTFDWNLTGAATRSNPNSTEKTWNLTDLAAGTYTVSCTVKNTDDCTITLTNATFTIYPKATAVTATATATNTCLETSNTTITLNASVTTPASLPAGMNWIYTWACTSGGATITDVKNGTTTGNSITVTAPAGNYTFQVAVKADGSSCEAATANTSAVSIYTKPTVLISSDRTVLTCDPAAQEATLTANATNTVYYLWSNNDEGENRSSIIVGTEGTYYVTAYADAAQTCSQKSNEIEITESKNAGTVTLTPTTGNINCNNETTGLDIAANVIDIPSGVKVQSYQWKKNGENEGALVVTNSQSNVYTAQKAASNKTDNYSVVVTFDNGCTASPATTSAITTNLTKPTINVVAEPAKLTCAVTSTYITVNAEPTSTFEWKNNAGEPLTTNATLEPVTAPGDYTVTATSTENGCTNEKTITVEQDITAPVAQDIYSSLENDANGETATAYCAQDENKQNVAGVYFGLKSSETGVNYQLYTGGKTGTSGAAVAGTGNAISFGQLPEGTYSVLATKTATNCQTWMQFNADQPAATEEVTITKLDNPTISLTAANNVNCIAPFNGNIVVVTNGTHTSTDAYSETMTWTEYIPNVTDTVYKYQQALNDAIVYVKDANGCVNSATASIADNSATPEVFTVSGGGEKCEGTNDELTITLSDSERGFRYVLYVDGDNIADSEKQGTGDKLTWTVTDAGVYTVKAFNAETACEANMDGNATVDVIRCTDLMLDAKVDKTEVCEGSTLTYTLTLTNNASVDAQSVNVKMILPSNLSFKETMSKDSIIYIGDIPAGADNEVKRPFEVLANNAGENLETQFFVYSVNGKTYSEMDDAIAASDNFGKTVKATVNAMPDVLNVDKYTGLTYCVNETGVKDLSELKAKAGEDTSLQWGTEYIDAQSDWNWSATVPVISTDAQTSPNGQQIAVRQVSDKGCIGEEAFITYFVYPNPQVSLDSVINIKCYTGQGVSTGSIKINTDEQDGDNYAYNWYNGENFVSREQNPTGLEPGAYRLIVTYKPIETNNLVCADSSIVANISDRPDSIQITFTGTELVCGGERNGVVTSWVEGGTPGYQYEWTVVGKDSVFSTEPEISDLIGGDYNLELTDANGCVERNSFHIAQPDTLKISTETFTNFNCEDRKGFISLAISGGAAPYEYLWDNGSTDSYAAELEDGLYSVTVTDNNNCKADSTFQITKPEEFLTAYIESQRNVLCNGDATGQAIINVRGGTPFETEDGTTAGNAEPYIYNWSNNGGNQKDLINVPLGYYELTITDAMQCVKVIPVVIGQPEPLEVGLLHAKLDVCNGIDDGYITTSVNGGVAPYTYTWSNGENTSGIYDLAGGVYSLTVTDANNCPAEFEEEVQGYDPIEDLTIDVTSSDSDNRVLPGDKITFTAKASRELVSFNWDYTGWNEEQTYEKTFYEDGKVILWASDGICPDINTELPVEVVWPTIFSPYDVNGLNDEFLSPNADGKEERANWYIIVFNRYGQKVYEGKCGWDGTYKGKTALPGTYYYTIKFPNGESHDGTVEVSRQD